MSNAKLTWRQGGKMLVWSLAFLAVGVLALVGWLWVLSPGTPVPVTDHGRPVAGSLSEKVFLTVNGVRQGMIIKGRNPANPVLLHLHGGMPETFLDPLYPSGLEELFTVVWWEQRGSGLSYQDDLARETLNLDQLVSDTLVVTDYLRHRFGQDKIYLMGHSGGSFVGIHAAARAPEKFAAYHGVAQMSNQLASETEAYQEMLATFREMGRTDWVKRLEENPVTEARLSPGYRRLRDAAMHELGFGTLHSMKSVVTGLFLPSLAYPEYTVVEKFHYWAGKAQSGIGALFDTTLKTDLAQTLTTFQVPVYFFHGVYDRTCSYRLAKEYFDVIKAPVKGFFAFEESAHSPHFEEPGKMRKILRDEVLGGRGTLSIPH